MKFILDESQLKTFLELMQDSIYNRIKFSVEAHKDNGLGKWSEDSYWVKFNSNNELDASYILQACLHTGLRHNFNKYFKNHEPCF
jgi:hypothetical protein